jgi:HEAT repeat protein
MTQRAPLATLLTVGILVSAQSSRNAEDHLQSGARGDPSVLGAKPPNQVAWETLNNGLQEGDAAHRKNAIEALGIIGPVPEAVHQVEKGLGDKDMLVRQTAAATLGAMGSRDAIPRLQAALDDTSPEVSFTAAKALWDLGETNSRDVFQQVIEGERKDGPGKLQGALRDAKKRLTPSQLALMGAKEAAGLFGPGAIGIDAIKEVVQETKKDSGAPGRTVAAGILGKDPDPYALTLLEWALGDSSSIVRLAVARALADRGNQDTIPKLVPLLSDDRHAVRYMAAAAIVKLSLK